MNKPRVRWFGLRVMVTSIVAFLAFYPFCSRALMLNLANILLSKRIFGRSDWDSDIGAFVQRLLDYAAHTPQLLARSFFAKARLHSLGGSERDQIECLLRATQLDEKDIVASFELGRALLKSGERRQALAAFAKAPQSEKFFIIRGYQTKTKLGWEPAIDCFRMAEEIRPESAKAQEAWGQAQVFGMNNLTGGIAAFRRAIELDRNNPYVHVELAQAFQMAGRDEEAVQTLDKLKGADRNISLALSIRGNSYRKRGMNREALEMFSRAVQLSPRNPWFLFSYGEALWRIDRSEEARTAWRCALEIDPGFRPAADALRITTNLEPSAWPQMTPTDKSQ